MARQPELKADFSRSSSAISAAKKAGQARFLPNPQPCWGPKAKHKRVRGEQPGKGGAAGQQQGAGGEPAPADMEEGGGSEAPPVEMDEGAAAAAVAPQAEHAAAAAAAAAEPAPV